MVLKEVGGRLGRIYNKLTKLSVSIALLLVLDHFHQSVKGLQFAQFMPKQILRLFIGYLQGVIR